ncbi:MULTISPECIES: C45 family autoproteolytic acyltransferase/hydolase [unclassified Marinitoga]|uniref:C45 family autoproteolytic acyltransferase/hydolase n=1 Tax=unclassified Marinitoga TaxID=2640159 RepID=UPI00064179E3|nr:MULTISPECIES: C45 family peptidase [unclassified Marinitoga]KLO21448.1 hypothetical protein X274_10705 [Marinitoga sp. 1155]NUV00495.1 hypothetical protein [Marinitoga sp. 1154]
MKKILYLLSIIFLIAIFFLIYLFIPLNYKTENINNKNYRLKKVGNIKIVYLSGTPSEVGYHHGLALKNEINKMKNYLEEEMRNRNFFEKIIIRYTMKNYFRNTPSKYKEEMAAVARASNVDLDTIFLLNIYDEIFNLYGCTNIAVWGEKTVNNEIIHGRNLDYFLSNKLWDQNVLFVYNINDGNNFVSLTWPGIVGVLSGINEKGISLGSMTSESDYQSSKGISTGILYRIIMENAENISDVENILRKNKRTIGNNLMVSSRKDNKAVVFEFDSKNFEKIESREMLVSTNHFTALKNKKGDYSGSISRKIIAEKYLDNKQNISSNNIVEIMRSMDTGDFGNQSICRSDTVHSVIFLPKIGEIYIAANDGIYASCGRYFHFSFRGGKLKFIDYIDYSNKYFNLLRSFFYYKYQVKELDNKKIMYYIESFTKNRKLDDIDIINIIRFYKSIDLKEKTYEYIDKLKIQFENQQQKVEEMNKNIDSADRYFAINHYEASLYALIEGYRIIEDRENLKKYCEIGINDGIGGESNDWYEMKFREYYKEYFLQNI